MKPIPVVAFLCIACTASAQTASIPRTEVRDPRPLMMAAIDSATGESFGVLTGDSADAITKHFRATSPIYVNVTTLKRYAQPGCSRLNVKVWQEGVLLPGAAAPRRQTIDFGINYCRDGLPPRSLS